jgi:hypothetical protein
MKEQAEHHQLDLRALRHALPGSGIIESSLLLRDSNGISHGVGD